MTSIVKDPSRYQRDRVLTSDGKIRHSASNGDAVAKAMFGMNREEMEKVVADNGLETRMEKHVASPNGRYRMNLGNILRGLVRQGKSPKIGEHVVEKIDQEIEVSNYARPVEDLAAERIAKAKEAKAIRDAEKAKAKETKSRPFKPDPNAETTTDEQTEDGDDEQTEDNSLEAINRRAEAKRLAEASTKTAGKKVQGRSRGKKAA